MAPKGNTKINADEAVRQEPIDLSKPFTGATEADCQEIETSVNRSLKRRKEAITLLQTLEEAWKTGVCMEGEDTPNGEGTAKYGNGEKLFGSLKGGSKETAHKTLMDAQIKKRETEELQKKIFLSFKPLTSKKHEEQLALGQEILSSLPPQNLDEMILITEKTQRFFENESRVNREFLKEVGEVSLRTKELLVEITRIEDLKCTDKTLDTLISNDLRTLKSFLKATQKLFNG